MAGSRLRKDIEQLSKDEMDTLMTAFHHICYELKTDDENSFFQIAGYHGMPFRGAGWGNPTWWGGYCNHGNILFPTWHRAYVLRLEEALRTAPGCAELTMPFWNELKKKHMDDPDKPGSTKEVYSGVPPAIFLAEEYEFKDGRKIPNPLFSYKLQKSIVDNTSSADVSGNYTKTKGYQTVRYPFSGLVGTADLAATEVHNNVMKRRGKEATDKDLLDNVFDWLNLETFDNHLGEPMQAGAGKKFEACLDAPNYTVFSNTTSAKAWNDDHMDDYGHENVVSLESPHNKIHLAVGGFQVPNQGDSNVIEGANGDMGENDTASFDPIFFFHHCFIDYMFWQWQEIHFSTEHLDVVPDYPGTNSVDSQGATPGVAANSWLTLDSPLDPFKMIDPSTGAKRPVTSRDVTNIRKLGYSYPEVHQPSKLVVPQKPTPILRVSGANRAAIRGSFVISTWAEGPDGKDRLLDAETVLSRWHVSGCANCQTHLDAGSHVALRGWSADAAKDAAKGAKFYSMLHTRDNVKGQKYKAMEFQLGNNTEEDDV